MQALDAKDPKANTAEKGVILDIASSLVSLLSALAEAQDDILEAISANSAILLMIVGLITREAQAEGGVPSLLELESLNCLMVLTEDNTPLAKTITKSDCLAKLLQLKDKADGPGVLACGVLHNVSASLSDSTEDTSTFNDALLIPTLAKTLTQATESRPQVDGAGTFLDPIVCQQHAVEILASIGTNLTAAAVEDEKAASRSSRKTKQTNGDAKTDNEDEDMEVDDVDGDSASEGEDGGEGDDEEEEDDEMDEDEMAADMDMVTGPDEPENDIHALDDLPALKALISTSAIKHLVRIAALAPSDDLSLQLQSLALSALGNIAWSVSLIDFSDPHNKPIRAAWAPVATAIWEQGISPILASDTADLALATRVTSLAWAVARTLHGDGAPLKPGEHRRFIALYQATKGSGAVTEEEAGDPFQALGVKCVGVLGQLALHPAPLDLNREVGTFLVTAVASLPETPAADAVEALNQIFDIYGDEDYPYDKDVFWQGGFLKHLEEAVPKAKAMLKTVDKRAQPELRARADEAVLNLGRFLGYKKKHQS